MTWNERRKAWLGRKPPPQRSPPPSTTMPKFLTVQEVADILRRSTDTIYRWILDGDFPNAKKVKDGYLIPEADVFSILKPAKPEND